MILLDPDLEPEAAPQTRRLLRGGAGATANASRRGGQLAAPEAPITPRNYRLPAAATLARFLREAQSAVRLRGEVTVLLTNDAAIRRLNREFRGKNKATDVLSFPAHGVGAEEMAGDVAISVAAALRQALEHGHALGVEVKVLMLHGLLHLAGYDHETDKGQMARRERVLRARLGLPQGLIERADAKLSTARKVLETRASGAKARTNVEPLKYGLKPVPFTSKLEPFTSKPAPFASKPEPFTSKPVPFASKAVPTSKPAPFASKPAPFTRRKSAAIQSNSAISSSGHKPRVKAKRP